MSNCACWECKLNQVIVLLSEVRDELRAQRPRSVTINVEGAWTPDAIGKVFSRYGSGSLSVPSQGHLMLNEAEP